MRTPLLVASVLLSLALPTLRAGDGVKESRKDLLSRYISAHEQLRYLQESHRQAVVLVGHVKQGRAPGDLVYDEAEVYLQRVSSDLEKQQNVVKCLDFELKDLMPIGKIAAENARNRIGEVESKLKGAEDRANKLIDLLRSILAETAKAQAALVQATTESARLANQIKLMNDADKLQASFGRIQSALATLHTATEALDKAQKAADDATEMPVKDKANKERDARRLDRDKAWSELSKVIDQLKNDLDGLAPKASRIDRIDDARTILKAGYMSDGKNSDAGHLAPSTNNAAPGTGAMAPGVEIPGPQAHPDGEGAPPVEAMGEFELESTPSSTPPFVDALEPPDAPAPPRPAHCVSRELPLDDPAGSWRLIVPGTLVRNLPPPGDDDRFSAQIGSSPISNVSTTTDGTTTTTVITTQSNVSPVLPGREPIVAPRKPTRSIIFDCPATFPVMRFKDRFKSYPSEGVRIDEGMVLRFDDDGWYEVEFQAHGTSTPAVLRLQLRVCIDGSPGTLTLPPIRLDPREYSRLDSDNNGETDDAVSWLVVHRGSSSRLRLAFLRPRVEGAELPAVEVTRDGVARFGSGVTSSQSLPR